MDDTRPEIAKKVREEFQSKSPQERLKMGFSMHTTSKYLVGCAIAKETYTCRDFRKQLFLKFYGNDFDEETKRKILNFLSAPPLKSASLGDFEHISKSEKQKEWWIQLHPILQARLLKDKPDASKLLRALACKDRLNTWENIKSFIELTLQEVKHGEDLLKLADVIQCSRDPDRVMDALCARLRCVSYLFRKGFKNIVFTSGASLDFQAEFEGEIFHIATTYIQGDDFQSQDYMFTHPEKNLPGYRICPDKVIHLLKAVYSEKLSHIESFPNPLHVMVTDLEETHSEWLAHAAIDGIHPISWCLFDWKIPVVIMGRGTVYEPLSTALNGIFGKLNPLEGNL